MTTEPFILQIHSCCLHGILTKLQFLLIKKKKEAKKESEKTQLEIWVLVMNLGCRGSSWNSKLAITHSLVLVVK